MIFDDIIIKNQVYLHQLAGVNMKYSLFTLLALAYSFNIVAFENISPVATGENPAVEETDDIYWERPEYIEILEKTASKVQYVYHRRTNDFKGDWIVSLNMMPGMEGFSKIHELAIAKYQGREHLLSKVIPTLNCLWNDVVFLSPLHPHKHYQEYTRIGFTPKSVQYFKIPIEVLAEKRVTVWKWLSYKKYPSNDPIHESIDSYCAFDFSRYQELDELPQDTKEFYEQHFDPENPALYPKYNWYRIPHILCQDPIDITDERITIINWADEIEKTQ